MKFYFTASSRNAKTGPMPVVTATKDTCPDSCGLKNGKGCYAEHGHLGMFWARMHNGSVDTLSFNEFLAKIRALPNMQTWRYGQAGDLPPSRDDVLALAKANRRRPVICYTHGRDIETYREAQEMGFNINLSADTLDEADQLVESGLPVVVVLSSKFKRGKNETVSQFRTRLGGKLRINTTAGNKVAICPEAYVATNCLKCGLCASARRSGTIIGFPAHGAHKNKIDIRINTKGREDDSRTTTHIPIIRGPRRGNHRPVHDGGLHPPLSLSG